MRIKTFITSIILWISANANAQTAAYFTTNTTYKNALQLYQNGKYAAASFAFSEVEKSYTTCPNTSNADKSNLVAEAQYFIALCALQLDNDDAEEQFLNFIKQHPENPNTQQAYYQVGEYHFNKGNHTAALVWFKKVNSLNLSYSDNTEYKFKTAYAYLQTKDYEAAKPLFGLIKDSPSAYSEQATYYYAYIAYLQKNYKLALLNFERLKGSKNYENSYPYYITAIYFLDKRYTDVLAYAIPILKNTQQTNATEMLRIVAASYFAKADYENAAKYYETFIANDKNATKNNQDSYQIGYTYYKLKKYNQAIAEIGKLINEKNKYSQHGIHTLADAYLRTKNKQSARNAFQVASKLDFDKALQEDALLNFAKLSYELEFHGIALDAIEEFIKNYPYSDKKNEAKTLQAKILLGTKNYKAAIDVLEAMADKTDEDKETYQKVTYFRGLEFYNERAFENAISHFLRSNRFGIDDETLALSTYWCAEAMYEVKKYNEAVDYFTKFLAMPAAKKTQVFNFANYGLGYAALESENYTKAAAYYDKFLLTNEKDEKILTDATLRLADAYFGAKSYAKALLYYNRAISKNTNSEDYALFQRGVIQGLQNQPAEKIATLQALLQRFPTSNYADDASFEIAYTYFLIGQGNKAKTDLQALADKYPQSSYLPRAFLTIGLVNYDQQKDAEALEVFKKVINDYKASNEAQQALKLIERIYVDSGNATEFINYANSTTIGNYTTAEQDNILFKAAYNRFTQNDWAGTVLAVDSYFDKFNTPIKDKQAKFIRAESYNKLANYTAAIADYEYILKDWTSEYTERALLSIANIYLKNKQYNEAIVHLKKLEITSEYKANYSFAINNLMLAYAGILLPDETLKYVDLVKNYEKASDEDRSKALLYAGKAYLLKSDTTIALQQFNAVVKATKTVTAAQAKYAIAEIEYQKREYKQSQKTCFDLINNMPNYDYWVSKSFLLLADNYAALKDTIQAIATLKSIIDNYEGKDEILDTAKQKLKLLNAQ
ncbi:MAG: outer membrane protein assembly factor BamD [Sphingobacteriales bacterium]|nr:MAG: outer membrane protein assembly factor BamD [Sphingobacteriales bacterium]TAF81967.1 MAG: outer membrane protein assembly factor BamD [Sphingobacteriales bacterium]